MTTNKTSQDNTHCEATRGAVIDIITTKTMKQTKLLKTTLTVTPLETVIDIITI